MSKKDNVIIVRIIGGLGNQMFQYAAARALATSKKAKLFLDVSGFSAYDLRKLSIQHFNIQIDRLITERTVKHFERTYFGYMKWIIYRFIKRNEFLYYRDLPNLRYSPKFFDVNPPAHLCGNFQCARYFENYNIGADFTLKDPLSNEGKIISDLIRQSPVSVSIHLRRGDYNSNKNFVVISPEYYHSAVKVIHQKYGEDIQFFIFSDDIEVAKNIFSNLQRKTFVNGNTELPQEDIILMSQCNHHIIANSSFSWWGAYLNPSRTKTVIAPKQWFTKKGLQKYDPKDIYINDWYKI